MSEKIRFEMECVIEKKEKETEESGVDRCLRESNRSNP